MLKPPVPADSAEHLSEFGLIRRYFTRPARHATLGVGDDCALLGPRPGHELAISTDMLVAGRHFFADAEPRAIQVMTDPAQCGPVCLALPQDVQT
ncbi:hypothetical protein ACQCQE_04105, partial [Ralstonia pseudosolanacearum]